MPIGLQNIISGLTKNLNFSSDDNENQRFDEFGGGNATGARDTPLNNEPSKNDEVRVNTGPGPEPFPSQPQYSPVPDQPNRATVETDEEQRQVRNTNPGRPGGESGERVDRKFPNILNRFASYSVIQTLSVLKKSELADPDNTYRQNGFPDLIILKSGGVGNRSVRTSYEQELGITTEYFIEDLEVDAVMTPNPNTKQTNATLFRFKVIEPYSMGMLFETIANAVARTGDERSSYIEAPFLLTLDFIGYDDKGVQQPLPNLRRHFPLKIDNIEFSVNAGGSVYDVSAYAWNDQAFADEVQTVNQEVNLIGSTVAELLQTGNEDEGSLSYILNQRQLDLKDDGEKQSADAYVIMFPQENNSESDPFKNTDEESQGATDKSQIDESIKAAQENGVNLDDVKKWAENTGNINEIGRAKINKTTFTADNPDFDLRDAESTDDGLFIRNNGVTYDASKSSINIRKGRRIQDIVEDLVILSEYGQQLANSQPDSRGRKKWFRIESETYDIVDPENERQRGRSAKIYVYRIVPYLIHQSNFVGSSQTSPGIQVLKNDVPKEYNYLYTGKNDDIIDFDIQFNSAFYQAIQFDLAAAGQDTQTSAQITSGAEDIPFFRSTQGEIRGDVDFESSASSREQGRTSDTNAGTYSGGPETPATKIARAYNQVLVNGVDLIQAEMEIHGDPYFISDSGIGNYRAERGNRQTTADGTIDYQYSEPYLILNFRTPIDLNSNTGQMDFPTLGGEPVRKFSGIYKITELTNAISANKFTQRLKMIRLRNQNGEETEQTEAVEQGRTELFDLVNTLIANQAPEDLGPVNQSIVPDEPQPNIEEEEQTGTGLSVPGSGGTLGGGA